MMSDVACNYRRDYTLIRMSLSLEIILHNWMLSIGGISEDYVFFGKMLWHVVLNNVYGTQVSNF